MTDIEVKINISEEKILKAVNKGGKLDTYQLEHLARTLVETKLKAHMRKQIGSIDEAIIEAIEKMNWNEIIQQRIREKIEHECHEY